MADVIIYRPSPTATQQGRAKTREWVLEFVETSPRSRDPLMGWTSSADTRQQLRLPFASEEEAIAYAERNGLAYELREPHERRPRIRSYADNFRFDRVQ